MRILSIGGDKNLFKKNSDVRERMIEYGKLFNEIHIIVFSKKKFGFLKEKIADNVWLYPTNSKSKICYIFDSIKLAKRIIRNRKIDVTTTQDPYESGLVGYIISRMIKSKFHIQIHIDYFSKFFIRESLLNRIRFYISNILVKKADKIRVVSVGIQKYLITKLNIDSKKIILLPIYTDVDKIKKSKVAESQNLHKLYPKFSPLILMASRFVKQKNVFLAFNFLLKAKKTYPSIGIVLVGSGPEKDKYELYIKNKGLEDVVIIKDWVSDLSSYYKTCDIFLLTSNYEGYGRTIIEALASGTPVVSTDVGSAKELGAVIFDGSVDDLIKKVKEVLNLKNKKVILNNPYKSKQEYLQMFKKQFLDILEK